MQTNYFAKRVLIASVLACSLAVPALKAGTLNFSLYDSYGRKVTSQDYAGVPIFLEFGACW